MSKIKFSKSILVIFGITLLSLLAIRFSPVLYGGKMGLLKASLAKLSEKEVIAFQGDLSIENLEDEAALSTSLWFEGEADLNKEEIDIDLYIASEVDTEKVSIGNIVLKDKQININVDLFDEPIQLPLEDLIGEESFETALISSSDDEVSSSVGDMDILEHFLEHVIASEKIIQDTRTGYNQLSIRVTNYKYELEPVVIEMNVSNRAEVLGIYIEAEGASMLMKSSIQLDR